MKLAALLMALCLLLTGCGAPAADDNAHEFTEVTLILDYVPNTNHTGFYVAQELGCYSAQGLLVNIIEPGDNDATTLCAVGQGEFAVTYQENVTYARAAAEPLPIRAIATIVQHNTSGFEFRLNEGIQTPKDFEGKVYAGWQAPSEAAVLQALMEMYGADFSKLTMVGATGSGIDAMTGGIDFQWEFEGWAVTKDYMDGHEIGFIPIKDLDYRLDYYTPVIITNEKMIAQDPETVQKFMTATRQGYEYAIENPEAAAEILGKVIPETDVEFLKASQSFMSMQYSMDSDVWGLMKDSVWDNYTQLMVQSGLIDKAVPASEMYTNEFIG